MNSIPLSIQIDLMKFQLNSLILNNSLTDEVVIYFSQKLDKLIVKYELAKNSDALRKRAVWTQTALQNSLPFSSEVFKIASLLFMGYLSVSSPYILKLKSAFINEKNCFAIASQDENPKSDFTPEVISKTPLFLFKGSWSLIINFLLQYAWNLSITSLRGPGKEVKYIGEAIMTASQFSTRLYNSFISSLIIQIPVL